MNNYDQRVAKQLAFLRENNLAIHIPRKGVPYFTAARTKNDTHNRTIVERSESKQEVEE